MRRGTGVFPKSCAIFHCHTTQNIYTPVYMLFSFLLFVFDFRTAQSVKRGDYIFTTKFCPRGLCAERVVEFSHSVKQGKYEIYPPHTI